jgi:hypothetical protein
MKHHVEKVDLVIRGNKFLKEAVIVFIVLEVIFEITVYSQKIGVSSNDINYTFIEALRNKELKNYRQAIYLLNKCIESKPECGEFYFQIAFICSIAGDFETAGKYFKIAKEKDVSNKYYERKSIENLIALSKFSEAEKDIRKSLNKDPENVESKILLAEVLSKGKNSKKGLKILNEIERKYGISEKILFDKYLIYFKIGDFYKAIDECKRLSTFKSEDCKYYGIIAELYGICNVDSLAELYFEKLLNCNKGNINSYLSYARYFARIKNFVNAKAVVDSVLFSNYFEINEKLDFIRKFLGDKAGEFEITYYLKDFFPYVFNNYNNNRDLFELACTYYWWLKDEEKVIFYAKRIVNIDSSNPEAWERLFYFYNLYKKHNELVSCFEAVKGLLADRPIISFFLGYSYYKLEKSDNAISFMKFGLNICSNNEFLKGQFISYLSEIYYKRKSYDSSYYYFEFGISLDNKNFNLMNNYAYYLALNNDSLNKALKLSEATIKDQPKNFTFIDTYAWILYKQKNYKKAYNAVKLAFNSGGNLNSDIVEHCGDISFCLGDIKKAYRFWEISYSLDNSKEKPEEKLKKFKCN